MLIKLGNLSLQKEMLCSDDIVQLAFRFTGPERARLHWEVDDETLRYIGKLKDGCGMYLMYPMMNPNPRYYLLGIPVNFSLYCDYCGILGFGNSSNCSKCGAPMWRQ